MALSRSFGGGIVDEQKANGPFSGMNESYWIMHDGAGHHALTTNVAWQRIQRASRNAQRMPLETLAASLPRGIISCGCILTRLSLARRHQPRPN